MATSASRAAQKQRLSDLTWYRDQLKELIIDATDNATEDRQEAEDASRDRADVLCARADTAEHYAKVAQRILDGKTFVEDLVASVKNSTKPRRHHRDD